MCVACNYTIHRDKHNFGWSRDFAPALTCKPGETIHFECLDAAAGHFERGSTAADVGTLDLGKVNPVKWKVYVEGAEPGDALKITRATARSAGPRSKARWMSSSRSTS